MKTSIEREEAEQKREREREREKNIFIFLCIGRIERWFISPSAEKPKMEETKKKMWNKWLGKEKAIDEKR